MIACKIVRCYSLKKRRANSGAFFDLRRDLIIKKVKKLLPQGVDEWFKYVVSRHKYLRCQYNRKRFLNVSSDYTNAVA